MLRQVLTNRDICNKYKVTVRNKFDIFREISERYTPHDGYENFATAHIEIAADCTLTKQKAKYRVPWDSLVVRKKQNNSKKHSYSIKETQQMPTHRIFKKSPEKTNQHTPKRTIRLYLRPNR